MLYTNIYNVPEHEAVKNTLIIMKQLELKSKENSSFVLWVKRTFANYSGDGLFRKLHSFVRANFNYKSDVPDELLIAPYRMLKLKFGDCDDFSLFIKTVLSILNQDAKYLLLGKTKNNFSHICVLCDGVILDGTNNVFNTVPKRFINKKIVSI